MGTLFSINLWGCYYSRFYNWTIICVTSILRFQWYSPGLRVTRLLGTIHGVRPA